MKEKASRRMILLSVLFLALVVGITLVCLPYITRLSEPDFQAEFKEWVSDMGVAGPLKTLIYRSLTAFEEIAANGLEMPTPIHKGQKAAIITACNIPAPMSSLPTQGAGALSAMQVAINAGGYDLVGSIMIDGAATLSELPEEIKHKAKSIAIALTD